MADSNDWATGSDLASMSRGGNLLQQMGYDPDEVRANPALRAEVMSKVAGPYAATPAPSAPPPVQVAQNNPPSIPNPRSQNGNSIDAPAGGQRLLNRQQPSIPAPPARPVPDTLGAAMPSQPAPPPAPGTAPTSSSISPSGTPTPSIETNNARTAVGNLLAPEPTAPDTTAQDAMIAAKSIPINPNQPVYKEGGWGKVGRGLESAAIGLVTGGIPGAVVGAIKPEEIRGGTAYSAPNSGYGIDDRNRQAQLGLAEKQKSDAMSRFKQQVDLRKQQDTASKDAGEISNVGAKLPNETATAAADTARAYNESPAGKAEAAKELSDQTLSSRQAQISDPKNPISKASPADKAYFTAMGRLPDPDRYHAPEEVIAGQQAINAFKAQHGRLPNTLEEYQQVRQAAKGDSAPLGTAPDGSNLVDSIGTGKITADRLAYLLAKNPQLVSGVVAKYPDFDSSKAAAYPSTYKDFTSSKSGTAGGALNAGGTALGHLKELSDLNTVASHIPGSPAYNRYMNKVDTVATELAKFYGDSTVPGIAAIKKTLTETLPGNRQAAIETQAQSMGDKFDAYQQTWDNAAPSKSYEAPMPGISRKAMEARAALDPRYKVPDAPQAQGGDAGDHDIVVTADDMKAAKGRK